KNIIEGPPDLCVEILSPSSSRIDRKDKFKQYQDGGVAFYWIVDPEARTIEAFELKNRKYRPAGSAHGNQTVRLPPFPDLDTSLVPADGFPTPPLRQEPGVPAILVGDSAANVILGHDTTLPVSLDFMIDITAAVRRGAPLALLIADMPFGSYQASAEQALLNTF